MKKLISYFGIVAFSILVMSIARDPGSSYNARLNTYKYECKTLIKPARYEGSRITHYTASKKDQIKGIETYMVLDTEYKFAFSGKECSSRVIVRFYESKNKKILLKEIKNIQNRNIAISSLSLLKTYHKKYPKSKNRLKNLFIEYTISPTEVNHEAVVFVMGYKK